MAKKDEGKVPPEKLGDKAEPETPPSESGEEEKGEEAEAPLKVPKKLEGKSAGQLVKMYGELQKKLGEQGRDLGELKKLRENQQVLAQAIYADPKLRDQVEKAVQKVTGGVQELAETKDKPESKKGDEEAESDQIAALRRVTENRIINEFSGKFGLDKLKPKQRKAQMKSIGTALAEMLDPGGKKSVEQIIAGVDLERLPKMLENAYWIANKEALVDKGSDLDFASIGRPPSSSARTEPGEGLTERERAVAEKLGVKPGEYLKQKKKIENK